jgi:hypothetical protein
MRNGQTGLAILAMSLLAVAAPGATLEVDDAPGRPGEWGFRPVEESTVEVNPPGFVWRPQNKAETYDFECSPTPGFSEDVYSIQKHWLNCHCPPKAFAPGRYYWRYRFRDNLGRVSSWSKLREFTVPNDAVEFSLPPLEELVERVPAKHPRLFVRPEELDQLRRDIQGPLRSRWEDLVRRADRLIEKPPPMDEPLKYDADWKRGEPRWLDRWWGNRRKVIAVVDGAATLAFVYMINGEEKYGRAARELMLAAAAWDPEGSTSYRYNDEAAMPVLYMLSRAYTWGYDALSEADRDKIRASMAARGRELFAYLRRFPHTWRPYASHRNRSWHFLGELSIAFLDEIEGAPQWLEHSVNTFWCCYPVWSDTDGGWHEGASYWSSYIARQTYWLDVMASALKVDGYQRPFFRRAGYFPIYVMPPRTECGGFGDLALRRSPRSVGNTMAILARGAQNPHWQWYVDQVGGDIGSGYLGFLRARRPAPEPKAPSDLPQSKVFRGTGLAMLHTNLRDARRDVQVFFKSSPMGSQSHGFNAQNSFILAVAGEPLLIWTGSRDWHGSPHHTRWMWETKSQNCILVNGQGQRKHTRTPDGRIAAFHTDGDFDYVVGEAADAYREATLDQFTRTILFAKPDAIVIYDQLVAREPSTYSWLLHCDEKFRVSDQSAIVATSGDSHARIAILEPAGLRLDQHNRFDHANQKRPEWRQWHFTAETPDRQKAVQFVTVIRPYTGAAAPKAGESVRKVDGGWLCEIETDDGGKVAVLLRRGRGDGTIATDTGLKTDGDCAAVRRDATGKVTASFSK